MLNLRPCVLKEDLKEAAAIEHRRRFEDERKKRIFNARQRLIGIDEQGLSKQINEKTELKEQERERQLKICAQETQQNAVATAKEQELQMVTKRFNLI